MTTEDLIQWAYKEDIPEGDITTEALKKEHFGTAYLVAKQDMVLSGSELFNASLDHIDGQLERNWKFKNGDKVFNQQVLCHIQGNLINLLKAERVALNFLGFLSGIATSTNKFVEACAGTNTKILDTRKTIPLYRNWVKRAVLHGGGKNHRMNLSDGLLVKENHLHIGGSIAETLLQVNKHSSLPVEVETKNLLEVEEAVKAKAHRIMFDNMSNEDMKKALAIIPKDIETEASGNMTLERVPAVAKLGVQFISVGAITHSAPSADLSLLFNWE